MDELKNSSLILKKIFNLSLRIAVGLALLVLAWSCATVPGLQEEAVTTFIRVPFVRVLLDESQEGVLLSSESSFAIECLKNKQQTVFYSSRPVRVENQNGLLTVYNPNRDVIQDGLNEVNIIPRGNNKHLKMGIETYRGILKALPYGRNVRLINIVYMEDYLKGVVPPEIGERSAEEIEAVKAQAVAARTYAMSHLKQYGEEPFDMKSSIVDQVYGGIVVERKLVNKAVEATSGYVVTWHDEFIEAYYHSTCGGMTDDIAEVWDRKQLPYLKPVTDDSACAWSKYYEWREVFNEEQLRSRIEQYLSSERGREIKIARITDVFTTGRTAGGRVQQLTVQTANDVYRFYTDRIRWVVKRASNPELILPSSNFDVAVRRNADSVVTQVVFNGRGYGHGIGMCQCGAIGLARKGWTFEMILKHYYTDTEVKKLY
ncbi:MAG: SpoIID/LytB domain-containing protein [Candidatus Zixiibacteriota bacterium]